jgi:AcrR family transcriptional regulator
LFPLASVSCRAGLYACIRHLSESAPYDSGISHRDDLLEAARRLILEKGFTATTARDLVAASGTNLGSIGYHFGSREALLSEAIEELFNEWTELIAGAAFLEEGASPVERLRATWKATLDTLAEHQALIRAFVEALAYAERSPEFRELMRDHYRRIQSAVAELVAAALGQDAVAKGADPMVVALFLIAVFDGLAIQFRMSPEDTPSGEELVNALAAAGVAARASRGRVGWRD